MAFGWIVAICSCGNSSKSTSEQTSPIASTNWLLGHWQNVSAHGTYIETWSQLNDSVYTAESYYIMENDTPSMETIRLEQHGTDLFYIPTVDDQNNNQPVTFKLTKTSDKQLVFENPEHDFPKSIVYSLINADSMVASISGPKGGKQDTLFFPMKRAE